MQDWFHRLAKLTQFGRRRFFIRSTKTLIPLKGVFAFMAAYGGDFSAATYSTPPSLDSEDAFDWQYEGNAFRGVVLTLAISRWILAAQYSIVFLYSHKSHRLLHLIQPASCALSGACCAIAWAIRGVGYKRAAGKILLVYGSIAFECSLTGYTARRKRGGGRLPRESMLAERFGLVTLVSTVYN